MENKIFKEYKYYDKIYLVDQFGNVYNENRKKLKQHLNSDGYPQITLTRGENHKPKSGRVKVHQIVAELFVPKKETKEKLEVNHKDFDRTNNYYKNLEWTTHKENIYHSMKAGRMYLNGFDGEKNPQGKLTEKDVRFIRKLYSEGMMMRNIYKKYYSNVVSEKSIENICKYRTWKNLK